MIPGSNILNIALSVIARQFVQYYRYVGRTTNNVGQDVVMYASPITINGSFQPLEKNLYMQYGLDLQKSYFVFYTSNNIQDISRDVSNDQIVFGNKRFQCESNTEWFNIDGWKGTLCCQIN